MDPAILILLGLAINAFLYLCVSKAVPIIKARRFTTIHLLIAMGVVAVYLTVCICIANWVR
jgi:hypothetical protein